MLPISVVLSTTDHAWAAGFFDAEGSVLVRDRGAPPRRELAVSQAGKNETPQVLERFRIALDGRGTIRGPRRGYLYYWRISAASDVDDVGCLLAPWLSEPKLSQLLAAAASAGRPHRNDRPRLTPEQLSRHERAWAAGFFGGDGTVSATTTRSLPDIRYLRAGIVQAGSNGMPEVLTRFRSAVGDRGAIRGPFMPKNPWSRQVQYAWHSGGADNVEKILGLLWPWLDDAKRAQARRAIFAARRTRHRRTAPLDPIFEQT